MWHQWKAITLPCLNKLILVMWYVAKLWRSTAMFGMFSLADNIILLPKLTSVSLEYPCKHILIMCDSDLELHKYGVPKIKMIFKGLTSPVFERSCYNCYNSMAEYKFDDSKICHIFDHLIWKNHVKKLLM